MKRQLFLIAGFLLLAFSTIYSQTYLHSSGSTTGCSGTYYDSGGSGGTYSNNENSTFTICSNAGNCVTATFTSFDLESGYDYLTIYNGPNTGSPVIGTYTGSTSPGTVTSTTGCLTFVFTSDVSVTYTGWSAIISCGACGGGGSGCLPNMANCTDNACSGNFYDQGGSGGAYLNNQNITHTICASIPGNCISVNFTSFDLESTFDYLYIYDGPNTGSPLIGAFTGSVSPGLVTSTSGCLTFRFTSDGSVTYNGWTASISCSPCGGGGGCLPNMGNCLDNACSGSFYDSGGPGSSYGANENFVHTICSNSGNCLRVNFSAFELENGFDLLRIYDGASTATPLLGTFTGTTNPGTITSSSGCLTFQFISDGSVNLAGWQASLSCVTCPTLTGCMINPVSGGHGTPAGFTQTCDDLCSSSNIPLGFTYDICGVNYGSVYVNMNGNVTFGSSYSTFTSVGMPNNTTAVMVAPFWADVDTRSCGTVYYQANPTNCIVTWYNVGYYSSQCDKLNTFQLILSNGFDPLIGVGNNTAFYFGDMNWTTGSASSGVGGFGGVPATVGINANDNVNYSAIGRYDHAGTGYDGPALTNDGVDWLDNRCFNFPAGGCAVLPINMLKITAKPVENKWIELSWSTNSEFGNAGFEIERSIDGIHFDLMGTIPAQDRIGNEMNDYAFEDYNVSQNIRYYYRMRQRDENGLEFLSEVVHARLGEETVATVGLAYPNPFSQDISFDLNSTVNGKCQLRLLNQLGQEVYAAHQQVQAGNQIVKIQTDQLAAGLYFLEVRVNGALISSQKVNK